MAGFWQKSELPHALLTKDAPPQAHSIGSTESHQLPHQRLHQRLPWSKSSPMHPGSQPQPPPRHSRSSPRQQPPRMQLKSTQTQRRKPGEPRRQAGGRTPTHLHFHGLQLLLSSSRRRHPPHLIMTGHEVAEKPAAGNEVLVSLQELAAPRIRRDRPKSRKQMPTRCARARIEAKGVHGDGAKSRTRHEKQIRCLAEWIPLGKRRADSGPRRALIARRPRELHEADPGHGPRRREKPQGRRASGCRARRRRQGRRSWPELGRDPGQSTRILGLL